MAETITKTATLTHKVRNPQKLEDWLNIWTATVSADFDENNTRTNEKIVIKPSDNWQIQADKLGTIPVTQISDVTVPTPTTDEPNKTGSQKNVSIVDPKGEHIAITKDDGSIYEGPAIYSSEEDAATKFLNKQGDWVTVETDVPFSATVPTNTTNAKLTVGKDDNTHIVTIKPQGKLSFEKDNFDNEIKLSLGKIETGDLDLTTADPEDDTKKAFRLPLENIEDLPINSAEVAGMVKKGNDKESPSVWLTTAEQVLDGNGNSTYNYTPDWGQIQTGHIENDAVTADKIAKDAVTENKIKDDAITENKIKKDAVTENKIKDDAVTEDKIADGSVTGEKLSDTAITDKFNTKLLGAIINEKEPYETIKILPETGYYKGITNFQLENETESELVGTSSSINIRSNSNNSLYHKFTVSLQWLTYIIDTENTTEEVFGAYEKIDEEKFKIYYGIPKIKVINQLSTGNNDYYQVSYFFYFNSEESNTRNLIQNNFYIFSKNTYEVPTEEELTSHFNNLKQKVIDLTQNFFQTLNNNHTIYTNKYSDDYDNSAISSEMRDWETTAFQEYWSQFQTFKEDTLPKQLEKKDNGLNEWDWKHLGIWVEI